MSNGKCNIPVNLFPFGFADEVANWQHFNSELIGRCMEAISENFEATDGLNRNVTSPALRKIIEGHLGEEVSNGAFIAAMVTAGYRYERVKCTPNCYFNVSLKATGGKGEQ